MLVNPVGGTLSNVFKKLPQFFLSLFVFSSSSDALERIFSAEVIF